MAISRPCLLAIRAGCGTGAAMPPQGQAQPAFAMKNGLHRLATPLHMKITKRTARPKGLSLTSGRVINKAVKHLRKIRGDISHARTIVARDWVNRRREPAVVWRCVAFDVMERVGILRRQGRIKEAISLLRYNIQLNPRGCSLPG